MKRVLLVSVLTCLLVLYSCDKPIVKKVGLVGSWHVYQIDSCFSVPTIADSIKHLVEEMPVDGLVHFYDDSTGLFNVGDRFTCGKNNFSWSVNPGLDTLRVEWELIWTYAFIDSLDQERLNFYIGTCRGSPGLGTVTYYLYRTARL